VEDVRSHQAFVLVIALTFFSSFLSLYTIRAHTIARHIGEGPDSNSIGWPSSPSGSLFPWPKEPGMCDMISTSNGVDWFIYRYLIKTWGLAGLSILAWVGTGLFVLKSMTRKQGLRAR